MPGRPWALAMKAQRPMPPMTTRTSHVTSIHEIASFDEAAIAPSAAGRPSDQDTGAPDTELRLHVHRKDPISPKTGQKAGRSGPLLEPAYGSLSWLDADTVLPHMRVRAAVSPARYLAPEDVLKPAWVCLVASVAMPPPPLRDGKRGETAPTAPTPWWRRTVHLPASEVTGRR